MLKTRILLKSGIALTALLLIATTLAISLFVQPSSASIVIDVALPDVPREIHVLEPQSDEVTSEQAEYFASALFNVAGEPTIVKETIFERWTINEDPLEVSIYDSGSITFYDNARMWSTAEPLSKPPTDTESKVIAEQFLKKLSAQGVSKGNLEISFNDIVKDTRVTAFKDNDTRITEISNVHVNFASSYNKIPVQGPGAKVRVYLGDEGRVIGFIGHFWTVKATQKQAIIKPSEAIEKLREVGYGMAMSKDLVSKATVKSIELVYYAYSPMLKTGLVPTYCIKGELIGKDGSTGELLQVVPAVS